MKRYILGFPRIGKKREFKKALHRTRSVSAATSLRIRIPRR